MDIVSHALFGRMLGRLDAHRVLGPGSSAAFVLGALAPDVDLVTAVGGWDRYLHVHEAGTHTVAATPIVALGVAVVVRAFTKESTLGRLWCAAAASALVGHLAFDLVSGSEMRLLAPFYNARLGPHWLAMADVLALGILVVGTLIGRWRRPRTAAIATFAALAMLLAIKASSQQRALEIVTTREPGHAFEIRQAAIEAVNGSLFEWVIYSREGNILRTSRVNVRTGNSAVRFVRRVDADAEAAAAHIEVPAVTTFLGLAQLPFPRIESDDGRRFLLWSDLRHCDADRCALSFGAELGPSGEPLREVIRIGPFEQSRRLPGRRP
jgi:LexA-binding, inner membrane-associated putative hydrolase